MRTTSSIVLRERLDKRRFVVEPRCKEFVGCSLLSVFPFLFFFFFFLFKCFSRYSNDQIVVDAYFTRFTMDSSNDVNFLYYQCGGGAREECTVYVPYCTGAFSHI